MNSETQDLANRVKKIIESKKMTNYTFEKTIGVTRNSIHSLVENGSGIGADKLAKIIAKFPEIDSRWLLTGESAITINNSSFAPNVYLYNIEAFAGFGIENFNAEEIQERWHIPNLIGKHIAISVQGNSMSPTIHEGDKIVAKEVFRNDLRDGNIYIIVSRNSALRVKRLRLYDNATMLWSDNPLFTPRSETLEIESVIKIYQVVMICKQV